MSAGQSIGRFRGRKWLDEAGYLTDVDRQMVYAAVEDCRRMFPHLRRTVGVRCPSYIGEPHPIATVIYGAGQSIYCRVYRAEVAS